MSTSSCRIVILDGYTLNPGDLSWKPLEDLGECIIYDRTPVDQVIERAHAAQILLTNKTPISREAIESLPDLKYIGVLATGYNIVDVEAAWRRGIPVTNVPTYGASAVAQATFALLLEMTNQVGRHNQLVHEGRWTSCPDWCFWEQPLAELTGKTMGLVGFGAIGHAVARLARAFGMKVLVATRTPRQEEGIWFVSLDTVFIKSDVISLHCPLTDETRCLVNASRLALMRPGALLLNTARGALVDEAALAQRLNEGWLAGAGLDVLSTEPPSEDNPLLHAKNCIITPHVGWAATAARKRLLAAVVENVQAFLQGRPENVVNLNRQI